MSELADYAVRSETRHEHLAELRLYGFRPFSGRAARELNDRLREERRWRGRTRTWHAGSSMQPELADEVIPFPAGPAGNEPGAVEWTT